MLRVLYYLAILIFFAAPATAQPYYFRHYQVEAGLSNNTVYGITQDANGFIWFGTKEGLNRFDGYRFKNFELDAPNERTLTTDLIFNLYRDPTGTLWVGAQKGLFAYNAQKETLVRHVPDVKFVSNMRMDAVGNLWFTADNNLYRYHPASKRATVFTTAQLGVVTSFCFTQNGAMWLSTADGFIKQFDAATGRLKQWEVFANAAPTASRHIQKIYAAADGTIFIGTISQGIKSFNPANNTCTDLITHNSDKTSIYVRDIIEHTPSEYWFATESGIFIYHLSTKQFTNLRKKNSDPYSLSDNAVYALHKDAEGGMWAGTFFGGVNYYPKQAFAFDKFFPSDAKNSIGGSVVREICPDDFGNLWIGTEDAGLSKLHVQTGTITRFEPTGTKGSIAYSNIHGLLSTGNDLWIGTFEHGLDIMDIRTGKVRKHYVAGPGPYDLKNNFIVCLLQAGNGAIYLGTSGGLSQYNRQKDGFEAVPQMKQSMFISSLIQDREGTVWGGTHSNGLFYFNTATGKQGFFKNNPDDKNSLTNDKINALYEDGTGRLWIATEGGGLCRLNKERSRFERFTQKSGLPSNFVFKVLEDNKGSIWASTSKGLANLHDSGIAIYTKANGLLNDQFNYNSGYADEAGKLYFGSVKGMISFQPDRFVKSSFNPPVYITGFQVHNKELEAGKDSTLLSQSILFTYKITLPHNQSSFSIDYSALSFTAPEMTAYSYKMEGLDKEWTALKQARKIYFTNLSPGTYKFRIKTAGNAGLATREKSLAIKILAPWWATWWAYALYFFIAASLLLFLFRLYHQHIDDIKEKELYEAKITFFTNVAHEIRTPLTLIKGPVENLQEQLEELPQIREDVSMLERNTKRLVTLVTQILDFRQTETKGFSLDFSNVNISALVQEEWESFIPMARKKGIACHMFLPQDAVYAQADEEALRKIWSNLFSNAVKYAAKEVRIILKTDKDALLLEVSNDGYAIPKEHKEQIFEPFYRLKETARQKGTGIGLALARSLTELHGGKLWLKEHTGTLNTFVLSLPLQPASHAEKNKKSAHLLTRFL